jgi:hypothetical protein
MESRHNIVSWLASLLASGYIVSCSAMPVKIQCSELQARIDYGDLTGDQLRFAIQELEDCRGEQHRAEQKDSGFVDDTERRFTPEPEVAPDSGQSMNGKN